MANPKVTAEDIKHLVPGKRKFDPLLDRDCALLDGKCDCREINDCRHMKKDDV